MLTALKSSNTKSLVRNEISPDSTFKVHPPTSSSFDIAAATASTSATTSSSSLGNHGSSTLGTGNKHYTFSAEEDRVEEKALNFLDRTGHLSQVAGSQSMLSQELLTQEEQDGEESQGPLLCSQTSAMSANSPMSMARRYGILTQETEEDVSSYTASTNKNSHNNNNNSFQTPPRKGVARKILTSQEHWKSTAAATVPVTTTKTTSSSFQTLEEEALNGTQPSLSLSQLEAVANETPGISYGGWQPSYYADQELTGRPRRGSTASLSSLYSAAQQHMPDEGNNRKGQVARSFTHSRQLPKRSPDHDMDTYPAVKKAKVSSGPIKQYDPHEPLATEISWVSNSYRYRESENKEQEETAKRASALAQRIMHGEDDLAQRLLLSMALHRDSPRQPPSQWPAEGPIPEGFVWAHYPPLEALLKENMEEYYNLSMSKCQSAKQQLFNNTLVDLVRDKATQYKWVFPTDRRTLRDRIRCYFKTHLQNAKKRLRTLLRNPAKRANAKNLLKLVDIIPDPKLVADLKAHLPPTGVVSHHLAPGGTTTTLPERRVPASHSAQYDVQAVAERHVPRIEY
jgi:hypothetical protein